MRCYEAEELSGRPFSLSVQIGGSVTEHLLLDPECVFLGTALQRMESVPKREGTFQIVRFSERLPLSEVSRRSRLGGRYPADFLDLVAFAVSGMPLEPHSAIAVLGTPFVKGEHHAVPVLFVDDARQTGIFLLPVGLYVPQSRNRAVFQGLRGESMESFFMPRWEKFLPEFFFSQDVNFLVRCP